MLRQLKRTAKEGLMPPLLLLPLLARAGVPMDLLELLLDLLDTRQPVLAASTRAILLNPADRRALHHLL